MNDAEQIKELEEELRIAMLGGDINKLDALISDNLIFTDHTGVVFTKEMDLHAHRSGNLKIDGLYPEEQRVETYSDTAIVSVLMRIEGSVIGEAFNGNGRYTRVWVKNHHHWTIVAGHLSMINA